MGSKGGLANASKTRGKLQAGTNLVMGGLFRKKERSNLDRYGEEEIPDPSEKPECTAAMAER